MKGIEKKFFKSTVSCPHLGLFNHTNTGQIKSGEVVR
jgi:hypothetical protein